MPANLSEAQAAQPQVIAAPSQHKPPALPAKPKGSLRVTGKLKTACELMVFGPAEGPKAGLALTMDEAAREAGLTTRAIRLALDKPHVRQYLNQRKQVFRASASAQNISRAVQLRDQSKNGMVAIQAIRYLDGIDEETDRKASARTPGVVIQIVNGQPSISNDKRIVDVTPSAGDE